MSVSPTCAVPVTAGACVFAGSIGAYEASALGASEIQPERWPPYGVPTVVPVSGTSTAAAPAFFTYTRPSWSQADTFARAADHAPCWTSVRAICAWVSCTIGVDARSNAGVVALEQRVDGGVERAATPTVVSVSAFVRSDCAMLVWWK